MLHIRTSTLVILLMAIGSMLAAQSGSLDFGFGINGRATFLPQPILNKAYAILEQPDHKILLAGYALSGAGNAMVLGRLESNGMADPDFGVGGFIQTSLGSDALCYAMALQSDGKILLAGGAATASNGSKDFALLRYLPNGSLDSTFSGDGIQTLSFGSGDDIARAILIQPDGNILVGGTSTNGNNSLMAIARVTSNGSPDVTFSGDGKNTLAIGTIFTNGYAMALLPDGKILMTGAAKFGMQDDVALARFLPNGSADVTFGTSGHITSNLGSDADSGNAIAIQPDGKILVAGITGASRDFALLRYLSDGTLDPDFGTQGIVSTDFAGSDDYANALLLQPGGKILLGGYAYNGTLPDFAVARYLPDGGLDPDFGSNGLVTLDFDNGYDYGFPLALQLDGKLLQAGYTFSSGHTALAVARYETGIQVKVAEVPAFQSVSLSPNPVSNRALFEFELLEPGRIDLSLRNLEGQLVQSFLSDDVFSSGKQAIQLDFSTELPDGWYVLQLTEGLKQVSVKILKGY